MQDRYNLFRDKDIRAYDRKLEQYALQQQKKAQDEIYKKYNQKRQEIQSRLGQAYGNPEAIQAIQDEYDTAKKQLKADLATTQDLQQYKKFGSDTDKEDFNKFSKEYDEAKAKKKKPPVDDEAPDGPTAAQKAQSAVSDTVGTVSTGLGAHLNSKLAGAKDPNSGHARNQAKIHEEQAAQYQKEAQANKQIANRDYRGEAEKDAVANAATENAQKIANMGNVSAGAAAIERTVGTADYNATRQRQDAQRAEGAKNMQNMHDNRSAAEEQRAAADKMDYDWQTDSNANAWNQYLSSGGRRSSADITASKNQDSISSETQPSETQPSSEAQLQNTVNYASGSPVRRIMDSKGNVRGYRVSNGGIQRAKQYDRNVSGEYSGDEYSIDDENALQQAYKSNPMLAQQEGESADAWTRRINEQYGRGGNLGDFGSGFYNNFAKPLPYTADQQNITSAVSRPY